ncbi:bifunctional folylpolyglutamate synthase/dihydrofolate synthase [Alkaliphilus crotonatoxidans]
MNYLEALDFIHGTNQFGSKLGLENIQYLLKLLGSPQQGLKIIHVAGTNGKGSTSAFLHGILKMAGYRVGLYTSPYLETFTERIQINGEKIPEEKLAHYTARVKEKIQQMVEEGKNHPTEFEVVTAIAFTYFQEEQVDYLVLEVGLGGRLDATNVVEAPLVSVITPIGFDHMQYLGNSLEEIAFEKGGIIKNNCITVISPQQEEAMTVLKELCLERNSRYVPVQPGNLKVHSSSLEGQCFSVEMMDTFYHEVKIKMLGQHQIDNCCTALWVIEALKRYADLKIQKEDLYKGLNETIWPGRLEVLRKSPLTIIDGAHNTHGAEALKQSIVELLRDYQITLVIGMLADKDVKGYLDLIIPHVQRVVVTRPDNPRAMEPIQLAELIKGYSKPVWIQENIPRAIEEAYGITKENEAIIVAGSLYMIGEARKYIKNLLTE